MLVKRNKKWHCIFYIAPGKQKWVSTKTANKKEAQKVYNILYAEINQVKERRRYSTHIADIADSITQVTIPTPGFPLSDVWDKYCELCEKEPDRQKKTYWNAFEKWVATNRSECSSVNDITRRIALDFTDLYRTKTAKTFNNVKGYLSAILRKIMLHADLKENVFELIPSRSVDSKPYRNFSDKEIKKILKSCKGSYWYDMTLLSYYTGLRKKDCFCLKWESFNSDLGILELKPAKTKRNQKAVYIHLHDDILKRIKKQKKTGEYIFPKAFADYKRNTGTFVNSYAKKLKELKIKETSEGLVSFHSLRATFVTNAEESGVSRQIIQGVVGHESPTMTKRYSHDKISGKIIKNLKSVIEDN